MSTKISSARRAAALVRLRSKYLVWIRFDEDETGAATLDALLPSYWHVRDDAGRSYAGVLLRMPRRSRRWAAESIRRVVDGELERPPLDDSAIAARGEPCGYRHRDGWRAVDADDIFSPSLWPLDGPRARSYVGPPIRPLELVHRASWAGDPLWLRSAMRQSGHSPKAWSANIRDILNVAECAAKIDALVTGSAA